MRQNVNKNHREMSEVMFNRYCVSNVFSLHHEMSDTSLAVFC